MPSGPGFPREGRGHSGTEIAWLEASGTDSRRIYERIGYRAAGNRLYISRP